MDQPSPSPRSSTVSGYVAERGSAVGTASPRLVYSRALISPRRVPSPRDLGPDAHAHSEISVAAGSSTSAVVVGEQLCRTLSASGNAGHPDTSRDFPDEQTISRPTPTNAPLCVAFLAGIRRPRHYTRRVIRWQQAPRDDEHDTHMRRQRCPRAPLLTRPRRYEASGTRADMVDIPDDPRPLPQTRRCRRDAVRIHDDDHDDDDDDDLLRRLLDA
ncbi:hypothetical protein GGF50DRAFT_121969 [Schizophyllum commune]